MFILENPYVSKLMLETLQKNQYQVLKNDISTEYAKEYKLNLISNDFLSANSSQDKELKVYSNSENSVNLMLENAPKSNISSYIKICKNKYEFRKNIAPLYPDFYFKEILLNEIDSVDISDFPRQFIIKPSVGFLSMGVHKVVSHDSWHAVVAKLQAEIKTFAENFPKDVLDSSSFIVEEIIEGDEFAVDAYYDNCGKPVVLNIFQHPFVSEEDVSDRAYISSSKIIRDNLQQFETILEKIGNILGMKNFPIHIEMIRRKTDGAIVPVEINPMRFAGWCTTDLAFYAYGINIYEYFENNLKPNWNEILKDKNDKIYYFAMAETPANINKAQITFDYAALRQFFNKVLDFRKIDYLEKPLFAIIFGETTSMSEITEILKLDINTFVNKIN